MRIALTLVFLSLTIFINAQGYIPIPSEDAEWFVEVEEINGDGHPSRYFKYRDIVTGDTIINDTTYIELGSGGWGSGYLYQDTLQEKVYYTEHPRHEPLQLLYDFSLSVGQSFDSYIWEFPTVISVDSIIISGVKRKRITFDMFVFHDINNNGRLCFIEGIGSNAGLFPYVYLSVCSSLLTCFQEGGVPIYPNDVTEYGCDLNKIIIADVNNSQLSNTKIYPNPFTDKIVICGDLTSENITTVIIYNVLGVVEYSSTLKLSEANEIDLSFLNSGVHLIKLEGEKSLVKVIVKE